MSGVVERLIEDWIDNCDERALQVPVSYLIARRGQVVKYYSKHSTDEQGKDLVAIDSRNRIHCYQLKTGQILKSDWRGMVRDELLEAAETPPTVPGYESKLPFRCVLVTSGRVSDPVRREIEGLNRTRKRARAEISYIERDELIDGIRRSFENFVPPSVGGFSSLLSLYTSNGRGPVDKAALSALFESYVAELALRTGRRAASSVVDILLAAAFSLSGYYKSGNHISVIEGWTVVACAFLRARMLGTLAPVSCSQALSLCRIEIESAQLRLAEEYLARLDVVEAPAPSENLVFHFRRTVVLGHLAAALLSRDSEDSLKRTFREAFNTAWNRERPCSPWGEGAWNYFLCIAAAMSLVGLPFEGENLVVEYCSYAIGDVPSPYVDVQELLLAQARTGRAPVGIGASFTLGPALFFLARRLRRSAVAAMWPALSRGAYVGVAHEQKASLLRWRADTGAAVVPWRPPRRGSWSELVAAARTPIDPVFKHGTEWLLPSFLLSYPHRVGYKLSTELQELALKRLEVPSDVGFTPPTT